MQPTVYQPAVTSVGATSVQSTSVQPATVAPTTVQPSNGWGTAAQHGGGQAATAYLGPTAGGTAAGAPSGAGGGDAGGTQVLFLGGDAWQVPGGTGGPARPRLTGTGTSRRSSAGGCG